ncbi:hypothetical protein K402DRAFT_395640 [Aulographum hederae CBS 113979]|uniref:Conidiation-specific protein 8 n=1 Tax=Aulographum hederae CBS 113979 TaxID=1176131 RepID=A0A6G1GV18_9PEZI|nr:hypothetical protein K402DRAFT_395640 [Aulographum hederae CBS 113979]
MSTGNIFKNVGFQPPSQTHPKDTGNDAAAAGATKERRSSSGAQRFANLMQAKRDPNDAAGAARRLSTQEQGPQPGMIGKMWHDWTKGTK